MQGNTLNLHTLLTSGVGFKVQILKLCRCKYTFIKLSTKTYLTGVCYDLNDTEGELIVSQITLRRGYIFVEFVLLNFSQMFYLSEMVC